MKSFFILFLLTWLNLFASGQTNATQNVIDSYLKNKNFNCVVLTARKGKIERLNAVGVADRPYNQPFTDKARFRIASITKTITAVLIMQFVEKGLISLTATIGSYLPDYHGEAKDLTTVNQLLTYSSGMPNCEKSGGDTIYKTPISVDGFISRYCSKPLDTVPGKYFNYDNGDYILLGRILEKATGKSFATLLNQQIYCRWV